MELTAKESSHYDLLLADIMPVFLGVLHKTSFLLDHLDTTLSIYSGLESRAIVRLLYMKNYKSLWLYARMLLRGLLSHFTPCD